MSRLVLRSMFEEDIEIVTKMKGFSNKEKRNFLNELRKEESEYYYYVLEERDVTNENGRRNVIGIANLKGNEDMDIIVSIKRNLNPRVFKFAKIALTSRIKNLIEDFYKLTNIDGIVIIKLAV